MGRKVHLFDHETMMDLLILSDRFHMGRVELNAIQQQVQEKIEEVETLLYDRR